MISLEDINKIAKLARIEMSEDEKAKMQKDLGEILGYMDELNSAPIDDLPEETYKLKNVFRPDVDPYQSAQFTEDILAEAPRQEKGYFKVKKVLG